MESIFTSLEKECEKGNAFAVSVHEVSYQFVDLCQCVCVILFVASDVVKALSHEFEGIIAATETRAESRSETLSGNGNPFALYCYSYFIYCISHDVGISNHEQVHRCGRFQRGYPRCID